MTHVLTAQSPSQAQTQYILTQAEYHTLVNGFKTVMKFAPSGIVVLDSVLYAFSASRKFLIKADYTRLLTQPVTMAFAPDKLTINKIGAIRGKGDICVSLNNGRYHIQGDHAGVSLEAIAVPEQSVLTVPAITWIGAEVTGYDSKNLKEYVGNKTDAVHLAIYDGQFEQVWVKGQDTPYTFTPSMVARLSSLRLDKVLISQVAFQHFGKKQSIRLGQVAGQYVLEVTTSIDMKSDIVVLEQLVR